MLFNESAAGTVPRHDPPIGSAFGILRPELLLTAAHVVEGRDAKSLIALCTHYSGFVFCHVDRVAIHSEADIAALLIGRIVNARPLEYFGIGFPSDIYPRYREFPLAEDILAYGFPMVGNERPIQPRMMKGHIQAIYEHTQSEDGRRYQAYELSFPAFPGLSGAPVFRDWTKRGLAIGMVTDRISYSTEQGEHETKAYLTVAAALHPIAKWIRSL